MPTKGEQILELMLFTTPDLSDKHPDAMVIELQFRRFGGASFFQGPALTIQCCEDNSLVKEFSKEKGEGRVMMIDGGGSLRKALLGDEIAGEAASNGWAGFIINGAVRDIEILSEINLGILALGVSPLKTEKRGVGLKHVSINIGGVSISSRDHIYADDNGVLVSKTALLNNN